MHTKQLEIALPAKPCRRSRNVRPAQPSRARWWFHQMHRVVDEAIEWTATPPARGNQAPLPIAQGQ